MVFAIQTFGLAKTFGKGKKAVHAVRGLDLQVPVGQVYGFLGANGSGKSTTIRMLLDLVRPTDGHVEIFGQAIHRNRGVLEKRVGALVDMATFYPFLTGRQNLTFLARLSGWEDKKRIQQLLQDVGIADRADRLVSGYSTGMKQRLGIAAALLNDPDLIILDEPANGLDPKGMQEVRMLIRQLAAERGKTVFLSSHILSEVEQLCDSVVIIREGQMVYEGAVRALLTQRGELRVIAEPRGAAEHILSERWIIMRDNANGAIHLQAQREEIPLIIKTLVESDIQVYEVSPYTHTLEELFLSLTEGENRV